MILLKPTSLVISKSGRDTTATVRELLFIFCLLVDKQDYSASIVKWAIPIIAQHPFEKEPPNLASLAGTNPDAIPDRLRWLLEDPETYPWAISSVVLPDALPWY